MLTPQQKRAIREAKKGNWTPADNMELNYINENIQPIEPNGEPFYAGEYADEMNPFVDDEGEIIQIDFNLPKYWVAKSLHRHYGPKCITAILWKDESGTIECYTDIDGIVFEEYLEWA